MIRATGHTHGRDMQTERRQAGGEYDAVMVIHAYEQGHRPQGVIVAGRTPIGGSTVLCEGPMSERADVGGKNKKWMRKHTGPQNGKTHTVKWSRRVPRYVSACARCIKTRSAEIAHFKITVLDYCP